MTDSERAVKERYERDGWTAYRVGIPDFLLVRQLPDGTMEGKFVEVKFGGDVLSLVQAAYHEALRSLGLTVTVERPNGDVAPPYEIRGQKFRFTKRRLAVLPTPKDKRVAYHDEITRGFCLLVEPSGRKSFCWFRKVNSRPTWRKLGEFTDLSIENARNRADELNILLSNWKHNKWQGPDPFGQATT